MSLIDKILNKKRDTDEEYTYWNPCEAKASGEVETLDEVKRRLDDPAETTYIEMYNKRLASYALADERDEQERDAKEPEQEREAYADTDPKKLYKNDPRFKRYRKGWGTRRFISVMNGNTPANELDIIYYGLNQCTHGELCNVVFESGVLLDRFKAP